MVDDPRLAQDKQALSADPAVPAEPASANITVPAVGGPAK
jgi:hypothetical protein